jgi:hypothetical protein
MGLWKLQQSLCPTDDSVNQQDRRINVIFKRVWTDK